MNPPGFIANPANSWITRWGARKATPSSVRARYEKAHEAAVAALDEVQDSEWSRGAKVLGEHRTVETALRSMRSHVEEHAADIRKGLGRA
jgi:hypothetical protein